MAKSNEPIYKSMVKNLGHEPGDEKAAKATMAKKAPAKKSSAPSKPAPKTTETGIKAMVKGAKPNQTPKQKIKRGTK